MVASKKTICVVLTALLLIMPMAWYYDAAAPSEKAAAFASFRDTLGITGEEIAAIEAIQARGEPLVYAALSIGETFELDGGLLGFAAMYCELMTELFGIEFRLQLKEWRDILDGLDSGAVAFTGEMTATGERRAAG